MSRRLLDWLRLLSFIAALIAASLAFRDHISQAVVWWRWPAELALGWVLLIFACGSGGRPPESARRRWLRRSSWLAFAAAAAVAAYCGPRPGYEVGAAAAALLAFASFLLARWVPFETDGLRIVLGESAVPPAPAPRPWQAAFALVAVALCVASVLVNTRSHLDAFLLWLTGLVLFAAAVWAMDLRAGRGATGRIPACGGPALTGAAAATGLVVTLVAAAGLRFVNLEFIPSLIGIDEGHLGRHAESLWKEGFPDPFGVGWNNFAHLSYLVGYTGVQLFGTSNLSLRLVTAAIGLLSLVPTFYFARRWWGNVVALLAVILLALNGEHIYWSRISINNIHQVLIAALVLAGLARALQTGRWVDWAGVGYALGFGFHTYHAAKLYPALLVVPAALFALGVPRLLRRHLAGAAVGAVAFVLVAGPLVPGIYARWDLYYSGSANRVDVAQFVDAYRRDDHPFMRQYIDQHFGASMRSLMSEPARLAILPPVASVPFMLGVGWMLWRWRDPRHLVLLAWTGGILLATAVTHDPRIPRVIGILPVIVIIPAILAGRLRALLHDLVPRRADGVMVPLLVAWFVGALYFSWDSEFVYRASHRHPVTGVCHLIDRVSSPVTFYSAGVQDAEDPRIASSICMIAADPARTIVNPAADAAIVPIPPTNHGGAVLVVHRPMFEIVPLIRHYYPQEEPEIYRSQDGTPLFYAFVLQPHEIEAARGLRVVYEDDRGRTSSSGQDRLGPVSARAFPVRARARGQIWLALPGVHAFRCRGGLMRVDGSSVREEEPLDLAAGWHEFELEAVLEGPADQVVPEWRRPGAEGWQRIPRAFLHAHPQAHGLLGRYFRREIGAGGPVATGASPDYSEVVPALAFDWFSNNDAEPPAGFGSRGATMEWTGTVELAEGSNEVKLWSTTPAQIYLDGDLVLETPGGGEGAEAVLPELPGRVPLLVRAVRPAADSLHRWSLKVMWRMPGGSWSAFARYHLPRPSRQGS